MQQRANGVDCRDCQLRDCSGLRDLKPEELAYIRQMKVDEIHAGRGDAVLLQGTGSDSLYTLYEGVLLRYRTLEGGRRQIVNIMFPGELIGLQGAFGEAASHTIDALVPSRLCVFRRTDFVALMTQHSQLAYDVIWLAAKEERSLEEHIVSLGQRNARERLTYLAVWLIDRARATGMADNDTTVSLPLTQTQLADMLGLSLVHTNRTLGGLARDGIVLWSSREITVPDMDRACELARFDRENSIRPFI